MTFDPTKPVQTRNGEKARILATDLKGCGGTSICALITLHGQETPVSYWSNGGYLRNAEHAWDLVNVPEEKTIRVKVTIRDNNVVKVELD